MRKRGLVRRLIVLGIATWVFVEFGVNESTQIVDEDLKNLTRTILFGMAAWALVTILARRMSGGDE